MLFCSLIEFFQKLESLEEELLIRNEAVHLIYFFTKEKYNTLASVKFQEADYNVNIISGLVGAFQSFGDLRNLDAINSIQFNYLRLLFMISEDYITVFAVDPEHSDEYYFKVIRLFLDCLSLVMERPSSRENEISEEIMNISLDMIFSKILENYRININYIDDDEKESVEEKSKNELDIILKEIYKSHEKFFRRVIK